MSGFSPAHPVIHREARQTMRHHQREPPHMHFSREARCNTRRFLPAQMHRQHCRQAGGFASGTATRLRHRKLDAIDDVGCGSNILPDNSRSRCYLLTDGIEHLILYFDDRTYHIGTLSPRFIGSTVMSKEAISHSVPEPATMDSNDAILEYFSKQWTGQYVSCCTGEHRNRKSSLGAVVRDASPG